MSNKAGDTLRFGPLVLVDDTGLPIDADATPTGTLYLGTTANGATVTLVHPFTGVYFLTVSGTSGFSSGDQPTVKVDLSVEGVATIAWLTAVEPIDTRRLSDGPLSEESRILVGPLTVATGGSTTFVLPNSGGISSVLNYYQYARAKVVSGTGSGQTRWIASYATNRTFTVTRAFATALDTSSVVVIVDEDAPVRDSSGFVSVGALAAGVITAASIASAALTSAKFSVSTVTGVATGFLEKMDQIWRRHFKKHAKASGQLTTYADDGTTVLTTQTLVSNPDGSTQSVSDAA